MAAMGAPARRVLAFDRRGTTRTDSLCSTLKRIEPVTRADVPTLSGARWSPASRDWPPHDAGRILAARNTQHRRLVRTND